MSPFSMLPARFDALPRWNLVLRTTFRNWMSCWQRFEPNDSCRRGAVSLCTDGIIKQMNNRQIFGILVRLMGLVVMVWSLEWIATTFRMLMPWRNLQFSGPDYSAMDYAYSGGWRLVLGFLFFRFADTFVRWSYPNRAGICSSCGSDIRATPEGCPECGAVPKNVKISN
jgi:hypothetical protein